MRWLIFAAASALSACANHNAQDQAMLEKQRLEAQSAAVFASVEEHAGCAGFHRAHAELASEKKNQAAFYTTAARNAEIAATEIATTEVQEYLAVEMVNELTETHAAEWAYAIDSKTRPERLGSSREVPNIGRGTKDCRPRHCEGEVRFQEAIGALSSMDGLPGMASDMITSFDSS